MLSVLQSSVHSTYYYGEKPFIWIENWPSLLRAEYNNVSIVRFDCCCFSALAPSLSSFFLLSFFHSWRVGSTALLGKFFPCPPFHHQLIRLVRFRNLRSHSRASERERREKVSAVFCIHLQLLLYLFSLPLSFSLYNFFFFLSLSRQQSPVQEFHITTIMSSQHYLASRIISQSSNKN